MREPDLDFSYTFTEQGSVFVRFYCANADASCDAYGETYEISIGVSSLKCPNAFSPLNEDGVNDEWKVSYSSIVSFQCSIYNRYGREMISFTDPAAGWDGRYGGKLVPAGVYYYVIKARGADGKEYKLSGDINIVDYK
ncbi:MAG: gliding motility-associated C-terminal domain-containing protein [Duncaniella sp.]|nr:gliding motility-associated C-terminal domain-containing protein [Duncaniella sp.]